MKRLYVFLVLIVLVCAALSSIPAQGSTVPPCSAIHHTFCPTYMASTECLSDWNEVVTCFCSRGDKPNGPFCWECPF